VSTKAEIASRFGELLGKQGYAVEAVSETRVKWSRGSSSVTLLERASGLTASAREAGRTVVNAFALERPSDVAEFVALWKGRSRETGDKDRGKAKEYAERLAELARAQGIPSASAWQKGSSPARVYFGRSGGYAEIRGDGVVDHNQLSLWPSQKKKYAAAMAIYMREIEGAISAESSFWNLYEKFREEAPTLSREQLQAYYRKFNKKYDDGLALDNPVVVSFAELAMEDAQRAIAELDQGRVPNPSWVLPLAQLVVSASGIHRGLVGLRQSGAKTVDDVTLEAARIENPRVLNMDADELAAWRDSGRWRLAGTPEGHQALRELEELQRVPASRRTERQRRREQKARAFYARHSAQRPLFGREIAGSGYSARHIGLLNWGHDPTKRSSPLHELDAAWLAEHPGAAHRRKQR